MPLFSRVRLSSVGLDTPLQFEADAGPLPIPADNQVLVAVEACGVCHRDLLDRTGRFPFLRTPITPGHEAAGRVIAVGPHVTDWKVGDRVGTMHRDSCGQCPACLRGETSTCESAAFVFGILADGGYASHLVAPQSAFYALSHPLADSPANSVSDSLGASEAAVLHCTFGTAYRDLKTLGNLQPGERVLITGANGGVGSAAIQIARRLGATVVAVARNESHRPFLESQGAHEVIIDPTNEFHKNPRVGRCDLALDTVGAPTFNAALRSLRVGGRLVIVGNIVNEKVSLNLGFIITLGLRILGGSGATRRDMAELLTLHHHSPLSIPIQSTLPLSRADEAQHLVHSGNLHGRVTLFPS